MKKKFFRLSATGLLFFSGVMEIGWRFFNMVVCCKRGGRKKERKKWFELSHIRDNHPRNGYAKEYDESRAWCETQKMQDCYIQSVDGLKLHGFYLPAEHAKRFVILSHGYRGSRFGSLSFMAKYLHEHQCNREASNLSVWTVYGSSRCTDGIRIQASVRGERADRRLWFSVYGKTDAGYG